LDRVRLTDKEARKLALRVMLPDGELLRDDGSVPSLSPPDYSWDD
jgi:hypothetical protein